MEIGSKTGSLVNGLDLGYDSEQWRTFYLFIANFFATQIIGGTKELVVLLWLSGDM